MKSKLFVLLLAFSSFTTFGQNYYSIASGSWTDNTSVWSNTQNGSPCSCNPGSILSGSTAVYIYNNISSGQSSTGVAGLTSLSGSANITIGPGDSAIISATSLSMSSHSTITVNGTLFIYAPLTMSNITSMVINAGGSVYVYGNVSLSNSALVTDNGSLTIHGNVNTSGSASFSGTGTSYVIGSINGPGTSFLSVLPDFFSSFGAAQGSGITQFQTSPLKFTPLQFNNDPNSVLTGNGTFSSISDIAYSSDNQFEDPCDGPDNPARWYHHNVASGNGFVYTNSQCTWVGIDVPGPTGYPTQSLDVGGNTLLRSSASVDNFLEVGLGGSFTATTLGITSPVMAANNNNSGNPYGIVAQFLKNSTCSFILSQARATSDFNPLVQAGDNGLIWTDGGGGVVSSGMVIAPWNPTSGGAGGIRIDNTGNVGIGVVAQPQYALDVNGTVHAHEVDICLTATCDFVFDKNYKLMSLNELENYLNLNHHLPGIASAKEMEEKGTIAIGKMNMQLLQKVEELTLYTIQQDKKITAQDEKIKELETRLDKLSANK